MASRRSSSGGVDWTDIALAVEAFEGLNNVRITLELATVITRGLVDLEMTAWCWDADRENTEAPLLASANAKCSALARRSLESAVLVLLYQLDSRLASGEFEKTIKAV